ncbi:MAG: AAA family ATPase [Candidatus Paceibacterota bacterium]|jgi:adenylate kinase family enzyme
MKIILFRGRPGVGKTTISNILSKKTGIPVLRKDDIYDVVSEFIESHQVRNKISYGSLYAILESNIKTNCSFIIDFPFHSIEHFSIIKKWCGEKEVELNSILVICSDERIWAERFNERTKNPKPNQLITNFEKMKENYKDMEVIPEKGELVVDTVKTPEVLLIEINTFIS